MPDTTPQPNNSDLQSILHAYKYGDRKDGYTVSLSKDKVAMDAIDRLYTAKSVRPNNSEWIDGLLLAYGEYYHLKELNRFSDDAMTLQFPASTSLAEAKATIQSHINTIVAERERAAVDDFREQRNIQELIDRKRYREKVTAIFTELERNLADPHSLLGYGHAVEQVITLVNKCAQLQPKEGEK